MKHNVATCPVCGQMIADAAAQARIKRSLANLHAENAAALRKQEKALAARFAADSKKIEKLAKEKAQKAFEAKTADIVEKTRQDEKRKNDRLLEQATKQNEQYRRQLERFVGGHPDPRRDGEERQAARWAFTVHRRRAGPDPSVRFRRRDRPN